MSVRQNTMPLPDPNEKDQKKVNKLLVEVIRILMYRNAQLERRVQALETEIKNV